MNVSRGDMIVKSSEKPRVEKQLTAKICWMDSKDLNVGTNYFIQSGSNRVLAKIKNISGTIATDFSGEDTAKNSLSLNEIGKVQIQLSKPLAIDSYSKNKASGSFILIDSQTNNTSGVGFVE